MKYVYEICIWNINVPILKVKGAQRPPLQVLTTSPSYLYVCLDRYVDT
jgi:hypothetical protein